MEAGKDGEQTDAARLEEIRQKWAKATPGPWGFGGNGVATADGIECIAVTTFPKQYDLMTDIKRTRANGEAIAAAPTDIAWLIALASRAVEPCQCINCDIYRREQEHIEDLRSYGD